MNRYTLYFSAPRQIEIREEPLEPPGAGQVLVETILSAISPGTEMLIYRNRFPRHLPADACIPALRGSLRYPLAYGYACVGRVLEIGAGVENSWRGRLVFAFQPHTSHFTASLPDLLPLPPDLTPETACFLPNTETAVNLVQDAAPLLGERALVFGQGIVGLLTTALLAEFPLAALVTADLHPMRRQASCSLGVTASLDPAAADFRSQAHALLPDGSDLTLELSGASQALNYALALTGFGGRVILGAWYGKKPIALELGGAFHRSRLRLIASQVSTIAPELSARWDKARRFAVAWEALRRIRPEKWITHRLPLERAAEAYRLLDESPGETIQILFVHHSTLEP